MTNLLNNYPSDCLGWTIQDWQHAYQSDQIKIEQLTDLCSSFSKEDTAWICIASETLLLEQIQQLKQSASTSQNITQDFPLYGVPFAVKDNIDVAGFITTAGCPDFAYLAQEDAFVVALLKKAGAIMVGKTNLDQFATGLVGTRSPYGAVSNSFNADYVSGGSSSGSASVVARGLATFSLGTDTAGSGRVPAGFNNIVGLKPTKGRFSNTGLVPACRLIDCISIFALTVNDANLVAQVMGKYDVQDAYARINPNTSPSRLSNQPKFAVPSSLEFFGDQSAELAFKESIERLKTYGATIEEIDFSAFYELAAQLYQSAWVAERTTAIGELMNHPEKMDTTVYEIAAKGHDFSAVDAYKAEYLRAELTRKIQIQLAEYDALVVPTSPTIHTIAEMAEQPIAYNSQFGTYTNFTNLADLSALALPSTFRDDGLPFGITLISPAWHDAALAHFGEQWQAFIDLPLGCTNKKLPVASNSSKQSINPEYVQLAVVGAHLTGMPLNFQLTTRNAVLLEQTTTSENYRLFALNNTTPPKPGLKRCADGLSIIVEVWEVPFARFGEIVAEVPTPLGIGNLELADGRWVKSFICEPYGLADAQDISHFGGWRAFIQDLKKQQIQ